MKLKNLEEYTLWDINPNIEVSENIVFYDKEEVIQLLNNGIILNSDQQKALIKLGLELIKLDGKHKKFNNARAISLIVEIVENHRFEEE